MSSTFLTPRYSGLALNNLVDCRVLGIFLFAHVNHGTDATNDDHIEHDQRVEENRF